MGNLREYLLRAVLGPPIDRRKGSITSTQKERNGKANTKTACGALANNQIEQTANYSYIRHPPRGQLMLNNRQTSQGTASEELRHFEDDHHLVSTA
jgi:hypothetical protein